MNYLLLLINGIKRMVKDSILQDPEKAVQFYRKKGVRIGNNVKLYNVKIDSRRPFLVEIGNNVILTNCRLLTHDASMFLGLEHTKVGRIAIGNNVFVGAESIILPNVKIGDNVVVGAGTVVAKDVPNNSIYVGNPARVIGTYDDFIAKNEKAVRESEIFINHRMTDSEKLEMCRQLDGKVGYARNN